MKLIRYNPIQREEWSPFDRLNSLRDLFDSAFALAVNNPTRGREWLPSLDVREDEHAITVDLEMPGMKKEDFNLSIENDNLTIAGERKSEASDTQGESFRSERIFGKFTRSLTLPVAVETDKVTASYKDGILRVSLPKAEIAKPKKIEVGIS